MEDFPDINERPFLQPDLNKQGKRKELNKMSNSKRALFLFEK
jgi:hypothetical protein